jgi:hypothetical protein
LSAFDELCWIFNTACWIFVRPCRNSPYRFGMLLEYPALFIAYFSHFTSVLCVSTRGSCVSARG